MSQVNDGKINWSKFTKKIASKSSAKYWNYTIKDVRTIVMRLLSYSDKQLTEKYRNDSEFHDWIEKIKMKYQITF